LPIVNSDNIDLGLGALEFGSYVGGVFSTYTDVGAIKTELSIEHDREVLDFETGRPLVVIKQEVIREKVTIKAMLAEISLATMTQALGAGTITTSVVPAFLDGSSSALLGTLQTGKSQVVAGTLLSFGGLPTNAFIGLRFTHLKADGHRHIFEGYKASPTGKLTLPFSEEKWSMYDAEFRLLADTSLPAGSQYYQMFVEGTDG
jgi:hypothetical protein